MGIEQALISSVITIFALGLLLVTLRSFYHTRNTYLLFIIVVFIVFLIKGILLSISIFNTEIDTSVSGLLIVFDVIILLSLFLGTLKKIP